MLTSRTPDPSIPARPPPPPQFLGVIEHPPCVVTGAHGSAAGQREASSGTQPQRGGCTCAIRAMLPDTRRPACIHRRRLPAAHRLPAEYCERGSVADVLQRAREGAGADDGLPWARRLELALGAARGMLVLGSSEPPVVHT